MYIITSSKIQVIRRLESLCLPEFCCALTASPRNGIFRMRLSYYQWRREMRGGNNFLSLGEEETAEDRQAKRWAGMGLGPRE